MLALQETARDLLGPCGPTAGSGPQSTFSPLRGW